MKSKPRCNQNLVLYILFDLGRYVTRQPVKALIKSLAWCGTSSLYVPAPINNQNPPILTPNEERSKKYIYIYLFLVFVMSLFIRVYGKLSWNLNDQSLLIQSQWVDWEKGGLPTALTKRMQSKSVCNFWNSHSIRKILFIGKHK